MTSMMLKTQNWAFSKALTILGAGLLAISLGATSGSAQQNQPDQGSGTMEQQAPAEQAPPDQSRPNQAEQNQAAPNQQQGPPGSLTLPAGTILRVRVDEWLSSDQNNVGDIFSAVLEEPIVVDGWVVARHGQAQTGTVALAKKERGNGTSELGLQLGALTLVDGQQLAVQTQMIKSSAKTPEGQQLATVGTTTAIGAVIGAIAGGGTGAVIGGGLGATAGIVGVIATRGKPTVIAPETILTFRLQAPVTISTERSQFAFQPVTQRDYDSGTPRPVSMRRRAPRGPGYPPPPYFGYPYPPRYPYGY
jgi:hypothetical protein